MAIARTRQINASVARWYHCVSRCVRRAFLLEEGATDRKAWIEHRIEELAQIFAVAVGEFAVMTNHLARIRLVVRSSRGASRAWRFSTTNRSWPSVRTLI